MDLLYLIPGAFFAPVLHEWVKARVSNMQGDQTPRKTGFMTYNPFKYFEPIGFILMMVFNVGWGRPVPTSAFSYKNRKLGVLLTYGIPVLVNFLMGILALLFILLIDQPLHRWAFSQVTAGNLWVTDVTFALLRILFLFAQCNIALAIFNFVPVHPMAMSKILLVFLGPEAAVKFTHYEKPIQALLFIALIFGLTTFLIFPLRDVIVNAVLF